MVCDVLLITVLSTLTFSQILAEDAIVSSHLDSDLNTRFANEGENLDEQLWNTKRASGFMPLRGRKDAFADDKRSSFMPLRGKKEIDLFDDMKRAAQGFMPMRGRRGEFGDYDSYYFYPAVYGGDLKRTSGFMPLRGKKDQSSDKRAANFHALRGKKDVQHSMMNNDGFRNVYGQQANEWLGHEPQSMDEKRARSAFYGLRGKRSIHL